MKKYHLFSLLAVGILAAAVLLPAQKAQKAPTTGPEFWAYISQTHPYTKWVLWPGHEALHPGQSPHGAFIRSFVNATAHRAIAKKEKMMPDGAIIVKQNYGDDKKTLAAITTMYKVKGYNPEAGDWFWAEYGPDGKEMASGKVAACIDCHGKQKAADYIFTSAE